MNRFQLALVSSDLLALAAVTLASTVMWCIPPAKRPLPVGAASC